MANPTDMVDRLSAATNRHDLEGVVACFANDYQLATPAHPARDFKGNAQVRKNWEQIFTFVPDIRVEVLRRAVDGDVVWSEWEFIGTRRDGTSHHMRGCIIFGVSDGVARWGRFFMEPVDAGTATADAAVREQVARK